MEDLKTRVSTPPAAGASPRLCASVEGVEFWIAPTPGVIVRCVITESALQCHYGADDGLPDTWVDAFQRNRDDIERRAIVAAARRDDVHVVIVTDSDGRLKTLAGRCNR